MTERTRRYSPARSAIIPMLVPVEELPAANALGMTVTQFRRYQIA